MALKKKENILFILLLIVTEITLPLVATQNIDCKGKAFHCVNSTHFKICVDLGGGVSTTVDDFLIPCPKSTVCKESNYFECEYHPTTTLKPTQLSEVTNDQISETPAVENFDIISTLNGSISDIVLSNVIISTTLIPGFSSTTLTINSVIDPENVTSVVSDSATYYNINTGVAEVSSNNILSTTTEKVILDNTELNFTKSINYSSEKFQSTDNNLTGATLNTYLASDVTEGYTKNYIDNKSTLISNTLKNHIDKDDFNHTSVKNESFLVLSSENISANKSTNIQSGVSTTEIKLNSPTTKNIVNEFSTENILRSSLYDEVAEQNTIASSQNILSTISEDQFRPFNPLQNEISITTDRNINSEYHQAKLFTLAKSDVWKEHDSAESNLLTNSFNEFNKNNILPNTETNTTKSKYEPSSTLSPIIQYLPTVKNVLYHQNKNMPTKIQGSFPKEKVVTDISYESTTEPNNNYETGRIREDLNVSTQNISETFNYSLSDLQSTMSTASNEYISFTGNPLQNTIYDEINNVSISETVIGTLNDGTKPINYYNYTSKHDKIIILNQTESISKTDGIETTETTRDNLHTTTTTEFLNQPNSVLNSLLSKMYSPNNTISVTKNKIQTVPVNITLPAITVVSKINSSTDATTKYDVDINKDIKTTFVNAGNKISISAVIDEPVAFTTIINVSDVETTAGFKSSKEDKTKIETNMYDSEKIPTAVTLVAENYSSSTDSNITSKIEILNNTEFKDMAFTADTTEPYVSTSEINDASLFKAAEYTNIDKINTIITKEKHAAYIPVSNITISGGIDVSMQKYNNINNLEKVDMDINKSNDINLLKLSSKVNPGVTVTEIYVKNSQSSPKSIETQNITTMKTVDATINKNNKKKILTINNTDINLEEYIISDEQKPSVNTVRSTDVNRLKYNNNLNSSNNINMQIFNSTNDIDEKYVKNRTDLVVNGRLSSNLNMNSPITEKKLTDFILENIYKAPNNVNLDDEEIKIDAVLSAVNGSQANITQIPDSNDFSHVNYTDIPNVIRTTTINVNFINGTGTNVNTHKNSLLNEMNLKAGITEADISSTEASVNSLITEIYYYNKTKNVTFMANNTANESNIVDINDKTLPHMVYDVKLNIRADTDVQQNGTILVTKLEKAVNITDSNDLTTHLMNNTEFDQSPDVYITLDIEDNIQKNNSINEFDFFANTTVSDVITESLNIAMLDPNIDEVKEINSIASTAIHDINFTEENNNRQTYNNTLPIQLNIADIIMLEKNHTKNIDNKQTHYNIEPNITKYNKFGLEKTTDNVSVSKILSKSIADLNLEKYNNSYANVLEDRAVDMNVANSTNKGIQRVNITESKEIKLLIDNIDATAIDNINMPTYNNTDDSQIKIKIVHDLSNNNDVNINTHAAIKTNAEKRLDITMDNLQMFNNTLANKNIAESNDDHIKIQSDTPIESSKLIPEHTILGFNVTKSNDVNLNTGTVDPFNIKSSPTSQQIYNNTQMHDMISMSNVRVLNKSEGNTKENNVIKVKGTNVHSTPKDNSNQTYPEDVENQNIKLELRSNQTLTSNNNSKIPYVAKQEVSASFYPVIAGSSEEIDTNSSQSAKNKTNLRNSLDILNSKKPFEAVTLFNSEIRVHATPEVTSDLPFINNFTVPNRSMISNLSYIMESTLENISIKSRPLSKLQFKNGYETLNSNNSKLLNNKTLLEVNGDESNINPILETNTSTPSPKIEPIEIIDYVRNIKVNEEASEDNEYLEMAPNNEKKLSIITNTEETELTKYAYFVQHVNISSSTSFTCNVGSRGNYSDENDCNKFYICIGKLTPIIGRCPGDTVFSEINKQCTKNLSHCIRNNQFRCLAEGRFIDILSNNFYYICAKNPSKGLVRFKLKCQDGYRLNTDTVHCTLKPSSIENDSKNNSETSTEEKLPSESDQSKISFTCGKEGLFEFPDDCRKYFHCTKISKSEFRRKIKNCDSDEVFDKDKQKCVDEDSHEEVNGNESNINQILKINTSTPSSKIEPSEIIDYVKNIKVNEEASEDNTNLETAPKNEKKQSIITNTEKNDLSKSAYFVPQVDISSPTPFTCNKRSRGKYSDKNDCNKFYICIGKLTPIIRRCPGDTVFSEINKQCTKNLSHCIRNNQFRCLAEGRFIDVLSNNFYYICAKNPSKGLVRFKLKCQDDYCLNTDTVHCTLKQSSIEDDSKNTSEKSTKEKLSSESDKSNKSFVCEKEGLFEFPDDCRKYFHCKKKSKSEFRRKIKKCDSDEVFDKDKQKCVDEDSHEGN